LCRKPRACVTVYALISHNEQPQYWLQAPCLKWSNYCPEHQACRTPAVRYKAHDIIENTMSHNQIRNE